MVVDVPILDPDVTSPFTLLLGKEIAS